MFMATTVKKGKGDHYPGSKPVSEKTYHGSTALYGRSGTGKTTLSGTWPKPILYLNIRDNGTDSISDLGEDVDVQDISSSDELRDVILWVIAQSNKDKLRYKTVVVDTMSQLQNILVEEKAKEKGRKEIKGSKGKRPGDFGTMTKQQWGEVAGDLKAAVQDIRGLPLESVFIAQERVFNMGEEEEDSDMLQPEVGPRLMPSVKDDLNASVSIIGNTYIRVRRKKKRVDGKITYKVKKEYCLRIAPHEVYTTKIRKPRGIEITDDIVDPSFAKLQKLMKGTK
jgi:KaiC/GvpD/RAD55 family RecA-like ATPase